MKIAIHYDSLMAEGGAERVVIQLANYLKADIITSGFNPKLNKWQTIKINVIDIGNFSIKYFKPLGILFEAPIRFLLNKKANYYDLNIYCGFTSIYGSNKNRKNIWYCLTPNRIMYDLKDYKQNNSGFLKKIILKFHVELFKNLDNIIIHDNFNLIISQSFEVKNRIKRYYRLDTKVIYPPIDTSLYKFSKLGDYYLTVGRLFTEKRIDLIIKAFIKMPDKKLIIIGDGPEKINLRKLIINSPNIRILDKVNDQELRNYYSECKAVIFMAKDEDFGLVPIEANASGKICIAVNEGGCKETVIQDKTGFLIKPDVNEIIQKVSHINNSDLVKMKNDCIKNARKFNSENSFRNWKKVISQLINL